MLGRHVARGAFWLVAARLGTKLLDFLTVIVLARVLLPEEFGLVALSVTVLTIVNSVSELPIANALVARGSPSQAEFDTAFSFGFVRGIAIFLVMLALAFPVAWLYDDPRIAPLVMVLALSPLARGLSSSKIATFLIDLRYVPQFFTEILGKLAGIVVTVVLVLVTKSYWAMVCGIVIAPVVSTATSHWFAPMRPRLTFKEWRVLMSFTGWLTLAQAVNTLNWQTDRLFVGGLLSKATLGQYVVGSEMASTSTYAVVGPLVQALFTGMVKVRAERDRLRQVYLISQQVVMALIMPIGIGLALVADPLVYLLLGRDWADAVFVVQVTAPIFSLQMLTAPVFSLVMALDQTRMIFLRDLAALFIRLPLVVLAAVLYGLEGVVYAIVAAELAIIYLNLSIVGQLLDISVVRQFAAPRRTLASVGAMAAAMAGFASWLPQQPTTMQAIAYVGAAVALGGTVYLATHVGLWLAADRPDGAERSLWNVASGLLPARRPA